MTQTIKTIGDAFKHGDYHYVAANGAPNDWRTHAALGLCGNTIPALERLAEFGSEDASFYEGVIRWLDGDERSAIRLLERCDSEHADNLLHLIRKPRISVLSQLPWKRSLDGPHTLLVAGETDPKFRIRNVSFAKNDLANEPNANIHDFYDANDPPDFYLTEMIEWHLIPPNLRELPCPTIGQTGDYDMHIQTVYPWLRLFDELVVTDTTEYADVAGLVDAPVTTFCKPVSLTMRLFPEIDIPRDIDLVLTGSLLHSYYPDKAEMMRQMLAAEGFQPFFLSGFLYDHIYYPTLARSKISVALTRHLGAIPSRGYEALAMGTVLLAPKESCMQLFADEAGGVIPFSLDRDGLKSAIETVMDDYDKYAERAKHGMREIRDVFNPWRVASQYLRMATFLAARPRPPRKQIAPPFQKRSVSYKGWLQENPQHTHLALRNASLTRWKSISPQDHTLDTYCDPARELMLEYEHSVLMADDGSNDIQLQTALNIYRNAQPLFPDALALRFNHARAAFHFGEESDIENALVLVQETLERAPATLTLEPLDDVMTWDYCQNFFNYRDYLQIATEALRDGADRTADLKKLVLASLNFYYGRMSGDVSHYAMAAELDPNFSHYRLWHAKALAKDGDTATAIALLSKLVYEILYAPEAWALIQSIKSQHKTPVPHETELRNFLEQMEDRTLIDEAYAGIRVGPYFKAQRLQLARNTGLEFPKKSAQQTPAKLSVLLADANGCRYPNLINSLTRQTLDRNAYEIIACDVFDQVAPDMMLHADTVIMCGQSEHLYNRNAAFNFALNEASGSLFVFFDSDTALHEDALAKIIAQAEACQQPHTAFVNAGGVDRDTIHTVVLSREAAIDAGGLDESAYFAGAYSGPYELVGRLEGQRWTIQQLDFLPTAISSDTGAAKHTMSRLFREIWPSKFAPHRALPLRENPDITKQRRKAS